MLQVRSDGRGSDDDYEDEEYNEDEDNDKRKETDRQRRRNDTFIGSWTDVPGVAAVLRCGRNRLAAVVDKGEDEEEEEEKSFF